jgi:hypothetical protein
MSPVYAAFAIKESDVNPTIRSKPVKPKKRDFEDAQKEFKRSFS